MKYDDVNPEVPQFSDDDLRRLAKIIGVSAFTPSQCEELQRTAALYYFGSSTDAMRPKRAEYRKLLKRITKAAGDLKGALGDHALTLFDESAEFTMIGAEVLEDVIAEAQRADDSFPSRGANPKTARKRFARDLAVFFLECTGKLPTFQRNKHQEPGGIFYKFVEDALGVIEKTPQSGLDHDVTDAIKFIATLNA